MSKELEKQSRTSHVDNLRREQKEITKAIENINTKKERIDRGMALELRKREIVESNFHIDKPVWKYETVPEYMEILLEQTKIGWKFTDENRDSEKEIVEKQLESYKEQLESLENEIKRLEEVD